MFQRSSASFFLILVLSLISVPLAAGFITHGRGGEGSVAGAHTSNLDEDAQNSGWSSIAAKQAAIALGYSDSQSDADTYAMALGNATNPYPNTRASTQLTTNSGTTNLQSNQYNIDCQDQYVSACSQLTKSVFSVLKATTDIALDAGFSNMKSKNVWLAASHTTSSFPVVDWEDCYTNALSGSGCSLTHPTWVALKALAAAATADDITTAQLEDFMIGTGATSPGISDLASLSAVEKDYLADCVIDLSSRTITTLKGCASGTTANTLLLFEIKTIAGGSDTTNYPLSNFDMTDLIAVGTVAASSTGYDLASGNYCFDASDNKISCLQYLKNQLGNATDNDFASVTNFKNFACNKIKTHVNNKYSTPFYSWKRHLFIGGCQRTDYDALPEVCSLPTQRCNISINSFAQISHGNYLAEVEMLTGSDKGKARFSIQGNAFRDVRTNATLQALGEPGAGCLAMTSLNAYFPITYVPEEDEYVEPWHIHQRLKTKNEMERMYFCSECVTASYDGRPDWCGAHAIGFSSSNPNYTKASDGQICNYMNAQIGCPGWTETSDYTREQLCNSGVSDCLPPAKPVVTNASQNTTAGETPSLTLTGTAEANAAIKIRFRGNEASAVTTSANASGIWSATSTNLGRAGDQYIWQEDMAGNLSRALIYNWVDTTAPQAIASASAVRNADNTISVTATGIEQYGWIIVQFPNNSYRSISVQSNTFGTVTHDSTTMPGGICTVTPRDQSGNDGLSTTVACP